MNKFFLPFKGVFCRVQPIAFDGTLSFLELLNKLQYYVNQLNENINAVADDLEALTTFVNQQIEEIYAYIDAGLAGKQDVLTWDDTPTDGSTNPVTSDGIYEALLLKQDVLTFDDTPTDGSNNPVTSDGIYDALTGKQDNLTFDTVPTDGSTNPVESNGIYDALALKQNLLTFDNEPTENSNNPVYSKGIKTYVDNNITTMNTALNDKQPLNVYGELTYNISTSVWSCTLQYTDITAYLTQNRLIILRGAVDADIQRNTIKYFYFTGFNGIDTYTFSGEEGYFTVSQLGGWTYTAR